MKDKLLFLISILGTILIIVGALFFKKQFPAPKVHYHAGFVVFQNDKKLDFSDIKYMDIKPCTVNGKEDEEHVSLQLEKAHLHDNVGDVVHIEAKGATWRDLFVNINFPIDEKKVTAYINAKNTPLFLSQPIQPNDSLVVLIGQNIKDHLQEAVSTNYISEMAKKSKTCGE